MFKLDQEKNIQTAIDANPKLWSIIPNDCIDIILNELIIIPASVIIQKYARGIRPRRAFLNYNIMTYGAKKMHIRWKKIGSPSDENMDWEYVTGISPRRAGHPTPYSRNLYLLYYISIDVGNIPDPVDKTKNRMLCMEDISNESNKRANNSRKQYIKARRNKIRGSF